MAYGPDVAHFSSLMIEQAQAGGFALYLRESFQMGGQNQLYACCSTAEETAGLILKMLTQAQKAGVPK